MKAFISMLTTVSYMLLNQLTFIYYFHLRNILSLLQLLLDVPAQDSVTSTFAYDHSAIFHLQAGQGASASSWLQGYRIGTRKITYKQASERSVIKLHTAN
jgi:hypothetical protein